MQQGNQRGKEIARETRKRKREREGKSLLSRATRPYVARRRARPNANSVQPSNRYPFRRERRTAPLMFFVSFRSFRSKIKRLSRPNHKDPRAQCSIKLNSVNRFPLSSPRGGLRPRLRTADSGGLCYSLRISTGTCFGVKDAAVNRTRNVLATHDTTSLPVAQRRV